MISSARYLKVLLAFVSLQSFGQVMEWVAATEQNPGDQNSYLAFAETLVPGPDSSKLKFPIGEKKELESGHQKM